jgi:transcriptional regulator with XRE-family HTH domain
MDIPANNISSNSIGQRLGTLRKIMKRSLRDCAGILDIPIETYLQIENGEESISLPQIEILSLFLGVPAVLILKDMDLQNHNVQYLTKQKRATFMTIRDKMIRSQLLGLRENSGKSLENLSEETGIETAILAAYETETTPIPADHLAAIAAAFEQPFSHFLSPKFTPPASSSETDKVLDGSQPAEEDNPFDPEQEIYSSLLKGLRKIPRKDLAQLAKTILNILKSS